MPLPEAFLQELKMRSDIVDVVSSYVSLRRSGRNMVGLCPFHHEKTPSFNVYARKTARFIVLAAVWAGMSSPLSAASRIWTIWKRCAFWRSAPGLQVPEDHVDDGDGKAARTDLGNQPRGGAVFSSPC